MIESIPPPSDSLDQPQAAARPGFGPWRDPSRRRKSVVVAVSAVLVVLMVDALWSLVGIIAMSPLASVPSDGWFESYDAATLIVSWVYLGLIAVAGFFFIRWQRLAIRNTAFLGCESPEPSPNLATIAWFIPFVSLIVPFVSIRRIALWSRPVDGPDRRALLTVWWAGWVIANLSFSVLAVLHQLADDPTTWIAVTGFDASLTVVFIVVGVLALKVVNTISRDQTEKAGPMPPT